MYALEGVYHYITSSVPGKGFSTLQIAIGQFPAWGIAGLNQSDVQPKFLAMADEILTAYRGPAHPNTSIEPYSNNKGKTEDGKLVPMGVKVNDLILFSKYAGTEVKVDGEELLIMREEDILGIFDK